MNKKPLIFRTAIAVIVIAVFALSIYPLKPLDFYETLRKKAGKTDETFESVIALAQQNQAKDPNLYAQTAVLAAADALKVRLTDYVTVNKTWDNSDVVSFIREQSASSIRLGLDLNGGAEFLVRLMAEEKSADELLAEAEGKQEAEPADDAPQFSLKENRDKAIEILRKRLEKENIFESDISPVGEDLISLKLPLVSRDEKENLLRLIKRSAKLNFHLVHRDNDKYVGEYLAAPGAFRPPPGYEMKESVERKSGEAPQRSYYLIKRRADMKVDDVRYAAPSLDQFGQREIILHFGTKGTKRFSDITKENVGRLLAIVLDGEVQSAPVLRDHIAGGQAVISGQFSQEEAQSIATTLISGSLPVKLDVAGVFDTDPTLGAENVKYGAWAGIIGLVTVMLFMLVYYMRAGIVANIALLVNIILILGAMATFSATLTLPGIAGIILTIGMAVDANVLIYERIREELESNKTLANAIDNGFNRAFLTILDSNLTTLMISLILWWQGSGAVKGFAVTLSIGIVTSMFTALFVSRLVFDYMLRYWPGRTLRMMRLVSRQSIDFMGMRKIACTASVVFVAALLVFIAVRGKRSLSIDFTGGTQIIFNCEQRVPEEDVRKTLATAGFPARVAYKTNLLDEGKNRQMEVVLRDRDISTLPDDGDNSSMTARLEKVLTAGFPAAKFVGEQESSLGGLVGWEFSKSAIIAILLSMVGIVIYISVRFEFSYAIGAIVAVLHDVIVATGIFLLLGRELSLPVIAALLTILGYSINDTIVIFDRIREDLTLIKNRSYKDIINLSINQTLSRTILTSGTTLIVVLIMLLVGGSAMNDFTLVMLIGIVFGTYSSIFVATPVVAYLRKHSGKAE
jgi:SecD/SecF fusion protein